jgi:hypothetical protein
MQQKNTETTNKQTNNYSSHVPQVALLHCCGVVSEHAIARQLLRAGLQIAILMVQREERCSDLLVRFSNGTRYLGER